MLTKHLRERWCACVCDVRGTLALASARAYLAREEVANIFLMAAAAKTKV